MSLRVTQLNRKLNQLREELRRAQITHERQLAELRAYFETELYRLNQEKNLALERLHQTMLEEDRRIAQEAISRVQEATSRQLHQLQEENENYRRTCDRLCQEISANNEELKMQIEAYLSEQHRTDEEHREYAVELIENAEQVRRDMKDLPLEQLSGAEFQQYSDLLEQAQTNLSQRMYQAAAAVAANARAMMLGLVSRLNTKMEEWSRYFGQWEGLCLQCDQLLKDHMQLEQKSCLGMHRMSPAEWDYWSAGTYGTLQQELETQLAITRHVRELGITKYLGCQDAVTVQELRRKIDEAYTYLPKAKTVVKKVSLEFHYSDERYQAAEKILNKLQESCYWPLVDPDFAPPDDLTATKAWYRRYYDELYPDDPIIDYQEETVDSLRHYQLDMTYRGGDTLHIRIVPEQHDGITVRNRCLLTVELSGAKDERIQADLIKANTSRLEPILRSLNPQSPIPLEPVRCGQLTQRTSQLENGTNNLIPVLGHATTNI